MTQICLKSIIEKSLIEYAAECDIELGHISESEKDSLAVELGEEINQMAMDLIYKRSNVIDSTLVINEGLSKGAIHPIFENIFAPFIKRGGAL